MPFGLTNVSKKFQLVLYILLAKYKWKSNSDAISRLPTSSELAAPVDDSAPCYLATVKESPHGPEPVKISSFDVLALDGLPATRLFPCLTL